MKNKHSAQTCRKVSKYELFFAPLKKRFSEVAKISPDL